MFNNSFLNNENNNTHQQQVQDAINEVMQHITAIMQNDQIPQHIKDEMLMELINMMNEFRESLLPNEFHTFDKSKGM